VQAIGLEAQLGTGGDHQPARRPHPADAIHVFGAMDHRHAEIPAFHVHHFDRGGAGIAQHQIPGQRTRARRRRAHPRLFDHRRAGRCRPNGG
jgi:hypothetical protein